MRAYLVASALAALLLVPASAHGIERKATDRAAGVQFVLNGRDLTVKIVPQPNREPPDAREELVGKRIRAVCAQSRRNLVERTKRWPKGQLTARYRFARDISQAARFCLVETADGGDVALVWFPRNG